MYVYDVGADVLVCASCNPTGAPPSNEVRASANGIFLSDDGRAFFSTRDALTPSDTDGLMDVYEYVQSRPQLISTGTAAQDGEGGISTAGLVGVSGDGVDVYFSTLETLASEDQNGPFLKFYDARTNGGFPVSAQIQPCVAADECHGAVGGEPPAPRLSSAANLGGTGNVTSGRKRNRSAQKRCVRRVRNSKGRNKVKRVKRCRTLRRRAGKDRRAGK
jgi:hypothetical protein